jgi:hypothetical protein
MSLSRTKECARKDCGNTIELKGRHCSRGRAEFNWHRQLCAECKETYCELCLARGCGRCDKGKLTERRLAQRTALERRRRHDAECSTCGAPPVQIAWEEYEIFLGDERIGEDCSRRVFAPHSLCPEGEKIQVELKSLGAAIDESGGQWGWDGCDWGGEPLERLQPGYREVVTWRRVCDEKERRDLAREWPKHG